MRDIVVRIAVATLLIAGSQGQAADRAPLEAYATRVSVDGMQLSPSGRRFAYQLANGDNETVFVHDTATGQVIESLGTGEARLRALNMVHDNWLLLGYMIPYLDFHYGDVGWGKLHVLDLQTGTVSDLIGRATIHNQTAPYAVSLHAAGVSENRDALYLPGRTRSNKEQMNLYRFSVDYGLRPKSLAQGTRATMQWFLNSQKSLFVREDFYHEEDLHKVVVIEGEKERVLYEKHAPFRELDFRGPTADWRSLVYATQEEGSDEISYFLMDLQNGSTSGPVFSSNDSFAMTDRDAAIFGFESREGPEYSYTFLDAEFTRRFSAIRQTFPGAFVELVSVTADRQGVIVRVSADWSASYYMYFGQGSLEPVLLVKEEQKVPRVLAVPRRQHMYIDDDGHPVRALVTAKPEVLQAGDAPAIVLAAYGAEWIAQYFASRDYVVVQPEVRGAEFDGTMAPQGEPNFRTSPVRDADLVVARLVQSGVVDESRMCVIGRGSGGFLALSSGFRSRHNYQCIAALSTYTDLPARVARRRGSNSHGDPQMVYLERAYNFTSSDRDSVREQSPHTHVAEISAPVLLIFFDKKDEMFERQAKSMAKALKKQGTNAAVHELKGDDVYLRKTATRVELLRALADFVSTHLPN